MIVLNLGGSRVPSKMLYNQLEMLRGITEAE